MQYFNQALLKSPADGKISYNWLHQAIIRLADRFFGACTTIGSGACYVVHAN